MIRSEMSKFHRAFEQLRSDYAAAFKAAEKGEKSIDIQAWQRAQESLVESTHLALQQQMTISGLIKLEDYVRSRRALRA